MKKFLMVVIFAALAAGGIWLAKHGGSIRTTSAAVSALLPKDTLVLIHIPDVNGTRAKWHETDLYKLWREPAIQDFLSRPLAKMPHSDAVRQKMQEIEPLDIKDAFLAITSWEKKRSKAVAGFRFRGSEDSVEKVIGHWRGRIEGSRPVQHQAVDYEKHHIEISSEGELTVATVYDGNWFFAANDLDTLKALLDRADGRVKDSATTLGSDEDFIAASKHLPAVYSARAYARVDRYLESLTSDLPKEDAGSDRFTLLRKIRTVSAATSFDNGKIRDLIFVATPKTEEGGDLTRASLSLATRDAIFYAAGFLKLPQQLPATPGAAIPGLPAVTQRIVRALSASGVTTESFKAAFGTELGVIGEWNANSRMPMFFATLPVKDFTKASELIDKITGAMADEDQPWTKTEKDGVQYFSQAPANPLVPIAATIALSNERLVGGHDRAGVESIIKRATTRGADLAGSDSFRAAERLLPAGKDLFAYVDMPLLYTRLDAALRPMLIMAAAFMPNIGETIDLGKLPDAQIVTKHLSPIVLTQRYENDGYVTESIGPISMFQALAGTVATSGASLYKDKLPNLGNSAPATSSASPTPTETPDE